MNFVVVGAGAWGTAFAVYLARNGRTVSLVPRRPEQARRLAETRQNTDYLPGVALPEKVRVTNDLSAAAKDAHVILIACPSQALRETCARIKGSFGTSGP